MEKFFFSGNQIERARRVIITKGHICEVVTWDNPETKHLESQGRIIYVPGIPGDTLDEFGEKASRWVLGGKKWKVDGVVHSGLIEDGETTGKAGATFADWVSDVKVTIERSFQEDLPVTIIGHSFGGLMALSAIAELVEEGKIDRYDSQLRLICVSSPFYKKESLPDERPFLAAGHDSNFSYYDQPMASLYAYEHIWDFLRQNAFMDVHHDKVRFNEVLHQTIDGLRERAEILKDTDIPVITLFPYLDRWVSEKAGRDLQTMMGRKIIVENFDIPSSYLSSMVGVNAHDLVDEWAPVVKKFL